LEKLKEIFSIKINWNLTIFLGWNIWRNEMNDQIAINQYDYIMDLSMNFDWMKEQKYHTPLPENFDATPTTGDEDADLNTMQ
jgi:hypothetical protein